MEEDDFAIGLDLGTKFSCIGVYRKGGVEIIPNSYGETKTPSVVIFKENYILVGEDTLNFQEENYNDPNCIYDIKRLIYLDFDNNDFKVKIKEFPFEIIKSENNYKEIRIKIKTKSGNVTIYSLVEIYSFIIKKW